MKVLLVYRFCGLGGIETSTIHRIAALKALDVQAEVLFCEFYGTGARYLAAEPNIHVGLERAQIVELLRRQFDFIILIDHPEFADILDEAGTQSRVIFETHFPYIPFLAYYFRPVSHPRIQAVFVPSEFNRRLVHEITSTKKPIYVLPYALDMDVFRNYQTGSEELVPMEARGKPIVLWVGRIEIQKNPEDLITMAKILLGTNPDLHFIIVGDCPQDPGARSSLEGSIPQSLRRSFTFIRAVPNTRMPELYSLAANTGGCFISTSIDESYPMVLLEAMACECPVVATRVGGVPDMIADGVTGRLYHSGHIAAGVEAVLSLVGEESRERREMIVSNALRSVRERHAPSVAGRAVMDALQAVADGRPLKSPDAKDPQPQDEIEKLSDRFRPIASKPLAAKYSCNPPTMWTADEPQADRITVKNVGTATWCATGPETVRLGVHFGTQSDSPHDHWATDERFDLPMDVSPGDYVTVTATITPPRAAGPYILRYRLVQEGVAWFDQLRTTQVVVVRSLTESAAPPMPSAEYKADPPTHWTAGGTEAYPITLTNTGSEAWLARSSTPVRLSVHFGTQSDWPHDHWATEERFFLPADVLPGESCTILIGATAPLISGEYVLRHRMVQEGMAWFDQMLKTIAEVV
jgi:glycosyltransferase involved in cell wall biosynthesis